MGLREDRVAARADAGSRKIPRAPRPAAIGVARQYRPYRTFAIGGLCSRTFPGSRSIAIIGGSAAAREAAVGLRHFIASFARNIVALVPGAGDSGLLALALLARVFVAFACAACGIYSMLDGLGGSGAVSGVVIPTPPDPLREAAGADRARRTGAEPDPRGRLPVPPVRPAEAVEAGAAAAGLTGAGRVS